MVEGRDTEAAGRIWFRLSLVEILLLAVIAWSLCRQILGVRLTPMWIPFLFSCLAFNTGVELALERGQSDILAAFLAWCAIASFSRGRYVASTFLSIWSASMKGYPILLSVGLGLLTLGRGNWRSLLAGGALGLGIFWFPVRHFMSDAVGALAIRKDQFWAVWYNHSFSNFVYTLAPESRVRGNWILTSFAFLVTVGAWFQARRALAQERADLAVLWLVAFGVSSLGTMVGYSSLSISYNLILILPGALVLVVGQRRLAEHLGLPKWCEHLFGATLLASAFLLFIYRLGSKSPPIGGLGLATSAFGLVGLFMILAGWVGRALVQNAGEWLSGGASARQTPWSHLEPRRSIDRERL
jgi:hypothetical protein